MLVSVAVLIATVFQLWIGDSTEDRSARWALAIKEKDSGVGGNNDAEELLDEMGARGTTMGLYVSFSVLLVYFGAVMVKLAVKEDWLNKVYGLLICAWIIMNIIWLLDQRNPLDRFFDSGVYLVSNILVVGVVFILCFFRRRGVLLFPLLLAVIFFTSHQFLALIS